MRYEDPPSQAMINNTFVEAFEAPHAKQDESPILACLRGNHANKTATPATDHLRHSNSNLNTQNIHSEIDLDDISLSPLEPLEHEEALSVDDADELVNFALRISEHSCVSANLHDSTTSGFSLDDKSLFEFANDMEDDDDDTEEEEMPNNQNGTIAPAPQKTLESLNQSITSLNEAFMKLNSCMDRTNQTRTLLKKLEADAGPVQSLDREGSQRSLGGRGPSARLNSRRLGGLTRTGSNRSLNSHGSGRRRGGLSRSSSSTSLNSHGSNRSLGSLGRKSTSKTTRKLRRNIKTDLRSEIRDDLTRGGLIHRATMPQQILLYET
eukprot:scaffold3359_cov123-Cylindrotheca_fusiformis.AAC.24